MSKKQKKMLARIIVSTIMLIVLNFLPVSGLLRMALYLAVYLIIGADILKKAGKGILNGRVCDENFLMTVATIGAIALAVHQAWLWGNGDLQKEGQGSGGADCLCWGKELLFHWLKYLAALRLCMAWGPNEHRARRFPCF